MKKWNKPSKEKLEYMMENYGSMGKVASELMVPYGTVRSWYNFYNLKRPESCRTIFHELRATSFSDTQKSVVLGSILGDGGLQLQRHSKNAKLHIKHCTKQKGYLKWKKTLLDPFSRPIYQSSKPGPVSICGVDSYSTGSFVAYTICHPDITDFFKRYYIDGKKRVNAEIVDSLDLLALSIWAADDGNFYSNKRWKNVLGGKMCTNSFVYDEQVLLKKALSRFFTGRIHIMPYGKNKDQYVLKLTGSKAVGAFLSTIREVLPECIHYKLDPQRLYAKPLN